MAGHPDINLPKSFLQYLFELREENPIFRAIFNINEKTHMLVSKDLPFMLPESTDHLRFGGDSLKALAKIYQRFTDQTLRHVRTVIKPQRDQYFEAPVQNAHTLPVL